MNNINFDIHLQMWDTAGQERFQSMTRQYFRNAAAVVIFFDASNANGLDSAEQWAELVIDEIGESLVTLIFIANKVDLGQMVADEAGIMLADKFNGHYLKNSSKKNTYQMKIMKLLTVCFTVLKLSVQVELIA